METSQDILLVTVHSETHELKVGTTEITPHDIHCPVCGAQMEINSMENECNESFSDFARTSDIMYRLHRIDMSYHVKMNCKHCYGVEL
jgi:hypothetical protein